MLGSTCEIPWPPFYESMLNTMAAINIDVSMIREPLNAMMEALGEEVGRASCNFNDMTAEAMCARPSTSARVVIGACSQTIAGQVVCGPSALVFATR